MIACAVAIASWTAHLTLLGAFSTTAPNMVQETLASPTAAEPAPEKRVKPKLVTPALVDAAEEFLAASGKHAVVGSEQYESIDGRPYVLVVEWHYHAPGFVGAPTGWHKGVTVYEVH